MRNLLCCRKKSCLDGSFTYYLNVKRTMKDNLIINFKTYLSNNSTMRINNELFREYNKIQYKQITRFLRMYNPKLCKNNHQCLILRNKK